MRSRGSPYRSRATRTSPTSRRSPSQSERSASSSPTRWTRSARTVSSPSRTTRPWPPSSRWSRACSSTAATLAAYMVTNPDRMEAVLEDPYVLITDRKISAIQDLLPVLERVVQHGKPLLIVAEDVEGEALATLVVNKLRGTFTAVAVKAPGFGDRRKAMLEDMAILTGGQVISEDLGLKLDQTQARAAGPRAPRHRHQGRHHDRGGRRQGPSHPGPDQGDQGPGRGDHLRLRQGEAAGAAGEARRRRRGDQGRRGHRGGAEGEEAPHRGRAVSATKAAVEEGIVAGGGTVLLNAQKKLDGGARPEGRPGDRRRHRPQVARGAGQADLHQRRARKARSSSSESARASPAHGYDALNDKFVDMFEGRDRRPGQGDPLGAAERGVDRGDGAHHRGDGDRDPRGEGGGGGGMGGMSPDMM